MFGFIKYMIFCSLSIIMISIAKDPPSATNREMEAVVEEFNNAMIHLNQSILEKITSEELSYGHSDGSVQSKNEFIDGLMNGSFRFLNIDVSKPSIQIVDNIAIVRHVFDSDYRNNQVYGHLQIGNLMIWRKEDQEWKLLARQSFKL